MCGPDGTPDSGVLLVGDKRLNWMDTSDLISVGRLIRDDKELRRTAAGFIGYGDTKSGDRVLLAVDNHYDSRVYDTLASVLREKGAKVDVVVVDAGPDYEVGEAEEVDIVMRREPWDNKPRRWEGIPWIERLAAERNYDLLVHGKGGGIPQTSHRYEAAPWLTVEQFASQATTVPREVHVAINEKLWDDFRLRGVGGRVHLTDPEGTDLTYTLHQDYFDGTRRGYGEVPWWGHVMGHGPTPILPQEDASGVVAGTMNHVSRAFPRIEVTLEKGRVEQVRGGGGYGDAWRALKKESDGTKYPSFPETGLFWLWEVAIGTNPKISRPSNLEMASSGGFEWERRRAGVIHCGFGTRWRGPEEKWAGAEGILYGHLHVHLLFPTLQITALDGSVMSIIEHGHLTVLDDPEIRKLAAKYGDPDVVLREDWIPDMPGINAPGLYEEYAKNPGKFIYATAK
jgi:hypothetical protein